LIEPGLIAKYSGTKPLTLAAELAFFEEAGLDLACFTREEPLAFFAAHGTLFLFGLVNGGLGGLVEELGFPGAMLQLASRPDEARRRVEEHCRLNGERGKRLVAAGARALIIGDDIAYNQGTYNSPQSLREILFPALAWQAASLRAEGVPVFFHSDGNLLAVLEDLAGCGFSGLHCLEEGAGMTLAAVRQKLPPPFCLMGGLDLAYVSPLKTAESLEEKIASLMEEGKKGGSYIFGTNGGLAADLDPAAAALLFRLSRRYAKI